MSERLTADFTITKFAGENSTGKMWVYETDKGKMNIKKSDSPQPPFQTGSVQRITYEIFSPSADKSMKIAKEWADVTGNVPQGPEKSQTNATQMQKTAMPGVPAQPLLTPQTVGMVINNSVALVVARIQAGTGKSDPVSIKTDIEYWNGYFVEMVQTGKITGVPF